MDMNEITEWLNAVVDAQVELWDELPAPENDEAWGFLREWRDDLVKAAYEQGYNDSID